MTKQITYITEENTAPVDSPFLEQEIKKEILKLNNQERATLLDSWKWLFAKHFN